MTSAARKFVWHLAASNQKFDGSGLKVDSNHIT